MRQRLVQVLRRQDDSDPQDPIVGRFWVQAKTLGRMSLPRNEQTTVVDLGQWVAARDRREK
jgi:hypothetical protein